MVKDGFNMKKNIIIIFLLVFPIPLFSFEGTWVFSNIFFQKIEGGFASIEALSTNIIERIELSNENAYEYNTDKYLSKKGKIKILTRNDTYEYFDCIYKDLFPVLVINILQDEIVKISIFITSIENNQIWYSYAISSDIQYNVIKGTTPNDNVFINFIGTMRRVR